MMWPKLEFDENCWRIDVGKEPTLRALSEYTKRRKSFLSTCLVGCFEKWAG